MGRRARSRALNIWANGLLVGQWRLPARGQMEFQYDPSWLSSAEARPLSLSMPINLDGLPLKDEAIGFYFDNLLPDSEPIRKRLQSRFHTASRDAFDLLAAIGRDCVGAVQLLPEDATPENVFTIQAEPIDDNVIEQLLASTVSLTSHGLTADGDADTLRISIAGAQEKTALTWHNEMWCKPRGTTPTTHIFKLPLGLIGNRQADMRTSVENEWLCAVILALFDVPVAPCAIHHFGEQKVLVVERFDRSLHTSGNYWLRLPQEDFCQATGTPGGMKYESDGGPGIVEIAKILQGSEARDEDLATLMRAQLLFWMLAATDGHAKNFSLRLLAGGRYRLTPLYDVLSAWPIVGKGPKHLDENKLRLAMALHGKNTHYRLREIQHRHFNDTAQRCGAGEAMESIIADVVQRTPSVIDRLTSIVPANFPADVFESITAGLRKSAKRL